MQDRGLVQPPSFKALKQGGCHDVVLNIIVDNSGIGIPSILNAKSSAFRVYHL